MMQGPIKRLARERLERRDDACLPTAWVDTRPPSGPFSGLVWFSDTDVGSRPNPAAPVLVMLGSENGRAFDELIAHAAAGARIYVLVPTGWDGGATDEQLLQAPTVLFRRVPEVPVSGIITADGARAWLGGDWTLRLDGAQADAFRQVFLRLFWHDATEEASSGGAHLAWRVAGERPFDVPHLPRTAPVRLDGPDARIDLSMQGALMHLAGGAPPKEAPRRLWFPAGADHHADLARLARDGSKVVWHHRGLPDIVVEGRRGEILMPGSCARLRFMLTPEQAVDAARILEEPGRWAFSIDLRLNDPVLREASIWLSGEGASRGIEPEQIISVADMAAPTLREMPEISPLTVPEAQPLALSARYCWTVLPPMLPAGTEEDPLVGRWRKVDADWALRVGRLRETLQALEGERKRIRGAFSSLLSAMLGFERTHSGLLDEVTKLEARRPSEAGPSGAPAMLSRLSEIEEQTGKLRDSMTEAERRAQDDDEREKQKAKWQSRIDAALQDLPVRTMALTEAEGQAAASAAELTLIEKELNSADSQNRKDIKARKQKMSDDVARFKREVARLRDDIAKIKRASEEPFVFAPPTPRAGKTSSAPGRFVPSSSRQAASTVPEEALPEVGELRRAQGQRYIVIADWQDLALGEHAANRLSAKLVAPEVA